MIKKEKSKTINKFFYSSFVLLIIVAFLCLLDYNFLNFVDYGDGFFESFLIGTLIFFFISTITLGWVSLIKNKKNIGIKITLIITYLLSLLSLSLFTEGWFLILQIVSIGMGIVLMVFTFILNKINKILYSILNILFTLIIIYPLWMINHLWMSDGST